MQGADNCSEALLSRVPPEAFVPANHPLRPIRAWIKQALVKMDANSSATYMADVKGLRPSVAKEELVRAMMLRVPHGTVRERHLDEQISFNIPFRWLIKLSMEDTIWNHSVFGNNRDRLIAHDADADMVNETVEMAQRTGLLSGEHFSLDGTLIQSCPNHKSIRREDDDDNDPPPPTAPQQQFRPSAAQVPRLGAR
jgi:transposase